MDVLKELDIWKVYIDNLLIDLKTEKRYKDFMKNNIRKSVKIIYSYTPYRI
jgi:hypothetical protein